MTKAKNKSTKSTVKAAAAKRSVTKSSAVPATAASPPLIVLGFDDQQKPRGARFVDAKPDLVTKAADAMGFKVYEASPEDVAEYAKKLPLGRLYANGRVTIAVFDDFCHANDPHQEHDFGAFDADGHRVFFKIDYFDESLTYHSPDPADPSVTKRVITIMLAEEY